MKLQCACGAKYQLDPTPAMAQQPVQFVCSACGRDSSEFVNALIRQELGLPPIGKPSPGSTAASVPASAVPSTSTPGQLSIRNAETRPAPDGAAGTGDGVVFCAKHPKQVAAQKCLVCSKPICPTCMALFGYVCSPLCRAKAAAQGINLPEYAGQTSVKEARRRRQMAYVGWVVGLLLVGGLGFWGWFKFWGSQPKPVFSVRFETSVRSGQARLAADGQLVFLHGGTLARYELKPQKQIWTRDLLDKQDINKAVEREMQQAKAVIDHANMVNPDHQMRMPDPVKLTESTERAMAAQLDLRISGHNVWVLSPGKLVRYDWNTGRPAKEIPLNNRYGEVIPRGEELVFMTDDSGKPVLTRVNLATSEARTESMVATNGALAVENPLPTPGEVRTAAGTTRDSRGTSTAGLPVGMPGRDAGRPMDPTRVAEQAQHLPLPARIALPALLAGNLNQERALAELNNQSQNPMAPAENTAATGGGLELIPAPEGMIEFSVRLVEKHIETHSAMKAPPTKSALDGAVTVSKTTDVANEILNEMQRSRGGDVISEDLSRYAVTLWQSGAKASWTGEVIGPPRLFVLPTVRVLVAGKNLLVFDPANRKLWQSTLNYSLAPGTRGSEEEGNSFGAGPCVERDDALYVFDEGVLTAFDRATGNVRWRLPSIGIAGLFFDGRGMMYVNTSTASPEKLKYSRQIDISQKAVAIVLKIDPRSGKTLWTAQPGGLLTYATGKYLFAVQSYQPEEPDSPYTPDTGFEASPYMRIKRIDPQTGQVLWEYFEQRAPLDVHFDHNLIELVFRKEVEVLKFLAF